MPCPFCDPPSDRVFYRSDLVFGLWDAFPVNEGHALLISDRHISSWFDAAPKERAALFEGVDFARELVDQRHRPAGYNIGINVESVAGQTVPHLHVHLIPRYQDDVDDPRGGVRHVIPWRGHYEAQISELPTLAAAAPRPVSGPG